MSWETVSRDTRRPVSLCLRYFPLGGKAKHKVSCAAERKASGGPVVPPGGHGSRGMQRVDGGNRRKRGFGNLEAPKSQPSSCAWGVMRGQFAVHQRGMGCRPVVQGLVQG